MTIDVLIKYHAAALSVISKAANYQETRPSNIGLSKSSSPKTEQVEGVGEHWTTADMQREGFGIRSADTTYRLINPLDINRFEPWAAAQTIGFFCRKAYILTFPKTHALREFLRIDKIDLTLVFPDYNLLSSETKKDFNRELCRIPVRLQIEIKSL
jgi:hypothetical protein